MPRLTVIAGPNGSGKTALTSMSREAFQDAPVLDPDAKAVMVVLENASPIEAGRMVLRHAEELLHANQSFAVETTLSGHTYLHMMAAAKTQGYSLALIYVGTDSVEINLNRVAERVLFGGHDVPEADQRRRYPRSVANLPKAFELADDAILFDNSGDSHRTVAVKDANGISVYGELPAWTAFLKTT